MTLLKTVNVTKERRVHLDIPIPENIPIGEAEVRVIFVSSESTQTTRNKNTQALCGMFADIGDTVDKFLARKRADEREYEE